jgi:hypothetical protein
VLLPSGLGDRWIYAREVEPGAQGFEGQAQEQLVQLIRTATGLADLPVTIERVGRFSFAAQLAERFREGRVFLTGDAAHRVTPRGGTGLNTSVHDGYDLGWKLAWVLKGWAPDGLLDSYECEREPVGRHNVEQSADSRESARTLEESLAYDLRGRLTHVWFTEGDRRLSTLDVVGTGLTLLVGPNGSRWHAAYAGLPPLVVRTLPAEVASQLDIGMTGAVLVRPDAQPVCRWSAQPVEPEAAVRAAVEGLTTGRSAVGGAGERRAVELVSAGDAE